MSEAGKALLRRPHRAWPKGHEEWEQTIAAIEAEAVAAERERIADAVEALPRAWTDDPDHLVTRAAVLAIVKAYREDEG